MIFSFGEVCLFSDMYVTLLVNYICAIFFLKNISTSYSSPDPSL